MIMAMMKKTGTMKKWTVMLIVDDNDDDNDDDDDDSLGRVELVVVGGKHMKGDTPPTPHCAPIIPPCTLLLYCDVCSAHQLLLYIFLHIVQSCLSHYLYCSVWYLYRR